MIDYQPKEAWDPVLSRGFLGGHHGHCPVSCAARRRRDRSGRCAPGHPPRRHHRHTAGLAPGRVQGNLAILPKDLAADFLRFCTLNPKPCPIIGLSEPGDPAVPSLGADLDIRTDLPRYRVWKDGVMVDEPTDIRSWWRDDLVSFVIGCSFSFEEALIQDGIPMRHIGCNTTVPMWRTNIACAPAGPSPGRWSSRCGR